MRVKESAAPAEPIPEECLQASLGREARPAVLAELHSETRPAADRVPGVATWAALEVPAEAPVEVVEQRLWGHLQREGAVILAVVRIAVQVPISRRWRTQSERG